MVRQLTRPAVVGLAAALLGVAVSLVPRTLELEENAGLAWLFAMRGTLPAPPEVVVVSIGTDSAEALGVSAALNEWPRSLHGELIEALSRAGAAVVVFDIIFDRPRVAEHDARLAAAIETAGNVLLLDRVREEALPVGGSAGHVLHERRVPPIEQLKRGALGSAPFPLPAVPVKVSQFWVFGRGAGDVPTLPAVALQAYALPLYMDFAALLRAARPAEAAHLPASIEALGELPGLEEAVRAIRGLFRMDPTLADELRERLRDGLPGPDERLMQALVSMYAGADSRYLDFYGPPRTVRTLPYHEVLASSSNADADLDLRGAVAFVGYSELRQPEQQDVFYSVYSQSTGLNLSGVEIAATALANLVEGRSIRPLSMRAHLALVAAWGVLIGVTFALVPALTAVALALVGGALYVWLATRQFQDAGVWLPLFVPVLVQLPAALLGATSWNYRRLQVQRRRIQTALGFYLPAAAVDRLAHESLEVQAGGRVLHGTCLVTDADRYTTLSEGLGADALGRLMNEYFAVLVEAVERHGGEVSDIGGDSMVAIWAEAGDRRAARQRACLAAMDIQSGITRFNRERGGLALPTRVGLDSGELLLGNVGAAGRFEYRAVGDIVNTASRIQGLNRLLGTRVLASARALDLPGGIVSRELGTFLLRGKREALVIYELLDGENADVPVASFASALAEFRAGRWGEAAAAFGAALDAAPEDGPSRYYLEVCRRFELRGVPPGWDGTIKVSAK